jgi:hypothetical protein
MEKAKGARSPWHDAVGRCYRVTKDPRTTRHFQTAILRQKLADMPEAEFEAGLAEATSRQRAV